MQIKTNRSVIVFILLSLFTLGIYSLFFWSRYARDVNTICEGDGRHTHGILVVIILSVFTLGIYWYIWCFGMQNRLRYNAERYGAGAVSGGGTVVLWQIFGFLLFGLGGLIGTFIQIDSLNRLAYTYMYSENRYLES